MKIQEYLKAKQSVLKPTNSEAVSTHTPTLILTLLYSNMLLETLPDAYD